MGLAASLHRDLGRLASQIFDVLVVGGGASGAATAREAALRGYSTALIEREDFSAGASAHCFKVVHGGIRYVQHGDVRRMRASCRERAVLLRIAPHLVAPLPFVIPTYGQTKSSKWFLGTGMLLYDALTADLNRHVSDPARRIQRTKFLGRAAHPRSFPSIDPRGLTGAAVFEDGQMYNPPRLVLGFVSAAAELGASVANYVEAERLLWTARASSASPRAIGSAGSASKSARGLSSMPPDPWAEGLLQPLAQPTARPEPIRAMPVYVVAPQVCSPMALAVQGRTRDSDALLARNSRHLFLVPWRDCTLVGVWHCVVPREPDSVALARARSCGSSSTSSIELSGFAPAGSRRTQVRFRAGAVRRGVAAERRPELRQAVALDRSPPHGGLSGLISLISVRYTVARRDAVRPSISPATTRRRTAVNRIEHAVHCPAETLTISIRYCAIFPRKAPALAARCRRRAAAAQLRHACAAQILALAESDPGSRAASRAARSLCRGALCRARRDGAAHDGRRPAAHRHGHERASGRAGTR
jgi:glycerol-3-phosphate dehydrogenase